MRPYREFSPSDLIRDMTIKSRVLRRGVRSNIGSRDSGVQRKVFGLAWPVIGENFLQTMLGIVDTLLVARLGAEAIAGVGSALQIMFFVISALSATSVGSSVLVAQAVGGDAFPRANKIAKQSIIWSILLSIPMVALSLPLTESIVGIFRMEPEVTQIGIEYLQVTMGTVVVLTLMMLMGGVLRGAGDSRSPMIVTAIANVVNIILTYGLIFGELGMPELGAVGSAWGTFISRALGCVILLVILWRGRMGITIRGAANWRPNWDIARGILGIGIPAALEQVLISAAFLALTIIVASLGTAALAGHRIAFTALSISFLPGIGFGIAATALVGQSIGAKNQQEGAAVARIATFWSVIWMSIIGIILFVFAEEVIGLFTQEADVVAAGATGLRTVALTQPFWAILIVQSGSLRGTGNTRFPLIVNATGMWSAVILATLLLDTLGGGLFAVWAAFLITAPLSSILLIWRFRKAINDETIDVAYEGG